MSTPVLSVVIPAHNAADTLVEQLDGIAAGVADREVEIVVVDNRSTDATASVVETWAASTPANLDVRVVAAADRAGEPYARNVGLDAARADRIAYCDADDIVHPGWVDAMVRGLDAAPYVTGPIDMTSLNEPWIADVRGSSVTGESLLWDEIPYAHGCNMGFRRAELEAVGGFDERYIAACDLDIAIRMFEAGHQLRFEPDAGVAYRLRPSLRATYEQGVFYGRWRGPIRDRVARHTDVGSTLTVRAKRLLWLARTAVPATWRRPLRARWVWVAGQLVGEVRRATP